MNPTTGNEILSYAGNVGLGLNADPQALGLYGDTNLDQANSNLFNLGYLNLQKNKAVYDQKIKDRDDGYKLISSGKLQVNTALPKDRERLMGMLDQVKKTYFDNGGDVKSDPRVWMKLNDEIARFNEAANVASSRYLQATGGIAEASKETNPTKRNRMLQHWNSQMDRDLFEMMDPYQPTMDWDNNKVFRKMAEKTETTGTDGYNRLTLTKTDLPESYRDFVNAYQQGDKDEIGLNVDTFLDSFYGRDGLLTPQSVQAKAQEVNDRLKKIAVAEGYDPNDVNSLPEYLKPMNPQLIGNQVQSGDYKWNDWFKVMLYDQYRQSKGSVFDKDLLDQRKVEAQAQKDLADAQSNRVRANAYADAQRAKADKDRIAGKLLNEQTTPAQNFDELKTKTQTVKTKGGGFVTRVNWDDLQGNTREFLGVEPLTAANGKDRFVNVVPTQVLVTQNGKEQLMNDNDVQNYYSDAVKKGYKGSVIDYLNSVGAKYDVEVVGREAGSREIQRAGRLSAYQNQMNKKNKTSLFLEEDNTPDEVDE